jgi:MFS transporter, DHA1 family, inner membrane transport protein
MTLTLTGRPPALGLSNAPVLALALGAFAIGTSEFMISGLLTNVAADLGVSIPSAGLLITGYAGGVALGGPLVTTATRRLAPKRQIMLLLIIFIAGNLLCALSMSYGMLMTGRIVGSFCHGAFYGCASVVATRLVPAHQRARAVALVSAGVMVANIVGVPLGTAIGQVAGWRVAFWGVSGLGVLAALALAALLPSSVGPRPTSLAREVGAILRPQVLVGLGLGLCFTSGLFVSFSYLTPLLSTVSGAAPHQVALLQLVFGAGATTGILVGGRLADWRLKPTLAFAFAAQIAVYTGMVVLSHNLPAMSILVIALGAASMLAVAPLRIMVLNGACDAPALASTFTSSTFNLGVGLGTALGAALITLNNGYGTLPFAGIAFAALGLAILLVTSVIRGS